MSISTIYGINKLDADHLAAVTETMRQMGAPTLTVIDCGDYYQACEGSHRLQAAHDLGLAPVLNVIYQDNDDVMDITGFDWYEAADWSHFDDATEVPVWEVASFLHPSHYATPILQFDF